MRDFYSRQFIPKMPPDTEIVPISRTTGSKRLADEMIFRFTHTMEIDWMLPGAAPTGKCVECGLVVTVHSWYGKLARERIDWDQASVLVQLGLLDSAKLPIAGSRVGRKVVESNLAFQRIDSQSARLAHDLDCDWPYRSGAASCGGRSLFFRGEPQADIVGGPLAVRVAEFRAEGFLYFGEVCRAFAG